MANNQHFCPSHILGKMRKYLDQNKSLKVSKIIRTKFNPSSSLSNLVNNNDLIWFPQGAWLDAETNMSRAQKVRLCVCLIPVQTCRVCCQYG